MKTLLLLLVSAFALWAGAAQADIYTWVDASGVRHYSDSPRDSRAKRADLPGIQSVEGNLDALQQLQDQARANQATATDAPDSRTPSLTEPAAGTTFRDARGIVPVTVTIGGSTELRSGEQITYYLDGSPIPESPTDRTRLELGNVPRGTHTLSAALLYQGRELRRTAPVTFYMQPPSAISPLNPGQGGDDNGADGPAGVPTAPAAGNTGGAPAAPRFAPGNAPTAQTQM